MTALSAAAGARLAPIPSEPPGSSGESLLWSAVLWQVLIDLALSDRAIRSAAETWIGSRPSRDFVAVCDLCGLHPGRAHAFFAGVLSFPWEARRGFTGDTGPLGRGGRRRS